MRRRSWTSILLLMISFVVAPQESQRVVKSWTFSLPHGSLLVTVTSFSDGGFSLGLRSFGQIPEAPIAEQIDPLRSVLAEMPSLGVDPHRLDYVGTHIYGEDVLEKLAYTCVDSKDWQRSMQQGGKGKEALVVALLNQSGVYAPYNDAFRPYGIQLRVSEAEKVGCSCQQMR
jgi:hypothetical protein